MSEGREVKSTLASTDSVSAQAESSSHALALLSQALSELDRIDAGTAVRARLQGIIDELAGPPAGELPDL